MATSALCIAEEETNFLRFGTGIIHVCPNALRAYFDTRHPNLAADLQANKTLLQSFRNKVITNDQWDLLFPSTGKLYIYRSDIISINVKYIRVNVRLLFVNLFQTFS